MSFLLNENVMRYENLEKSSTNAFENKKKLKTKPVKITSNCFFSLSGVYFLRSYVPSCISF